MTTARTGRDLEVIVLSEDDYASLGESDFGMAGINATEIIGPFVELHASGPLLMVHDGVLDPQMGIGHHPHRNNERLFYILQGTMDHDDSLNNIQGHMGTGDMGILTEGRRGMLHKEWNNTDVHARAFILVYDTDPVPETASFAALRDADAPRYEEGPGVQTKELVGPRVELPLHGDIRYFTDSTLEAGAGITLALDDGEGGMLVPLKGSVEIPEVGTIPAMQTVVVPVGEGKRSLDAKAVEQARVLRVVHGPGRGLVYGRARPR